MCFGVGRGCFGGRKLTSRVTEQAWRKDWAVAADLKLFLKLMLHFDTERIFLATA